MLGSVRGSTAFGVAVALAVGVASGWLLGGGEPNDRAVARESWLFSHTADAGEIREAGDGSLELVLRSFDDQVMAFTDRPFREAKIESVEWLVSLWDVAGEHAECHRRPANDARATRVVPLHPGSIVVVDQGGEIVSGAHHRGRGKGRSCRWREQHDE